MQQKYWDDLEKINNYSFIQYIESNDQSLI